MLGVDEQTLLSLLEVNRRPELEEAPTSEIAGKSAATQGRRRHRQRKSLSSGLSSENSVFNVSVVHRSNE